MGERRSKQVGFPQITFLSSVQSPKGHPSPRSDGAHHAEVGGASHHAGDLTPFFCRKPQRFRKVKNDSTAEKSTSPAFGIGWEESGSLVTPPGHGSWEFKVPGRLLKAGKAKSRNLGWPRKLSKNWGPECESEATGSWFETKINMKSWETKRLIYVLGKRNWKDPNWPTWTTTMCVRTTSNSYLHPQCF